ncbi:uncharacterized protein BDW43DRAFT_173594 [Aspergillus alliaceus]|uniref:uncharacterized protein n=1 Tax=Petromyces alliaceus TaxID=209559 RepID=UPI0012A4114B|nr:uncharacterized protein BDW43DRAFT_173594 [Aspergillus alliaceus]KAB8229965.1 hypothetical protein BDW43DRAFT_173594 [Aspergillus alliaceus]
MPHFLAPRERLFPGPILPSPRHLYGAWRRLACAYHICAFYLLLSRLIPITVPPAHEICSKRLNRFLERAKHPAALGTK